MLSGRRPFVALTVDLDASEGGTAWMNATSVAVRGLATATPTLSFQVATQRPPTVVGHTRASIWPQCSLYNAEGLPLAPFLLQSA